MDRLPHPKVYYVFDNPPPESFDKAYSCFITGHRNFYPTAEARSLLITQLDDMIKYGVDHFYIGGAKGFDTFAEMIVCARKIENPKIKLSLALPFPSYTHKEDEKLRAQFEVISRLADEIFYLCPTFSKESYQKRNEFMADRSSFCICWLEKRSGGTVNAVAYARRRGLRIFNLADDQVKLDT
ncbi:MAG: SLOG family protein [Eubacteriales bacterium]